MANTALHKEFQKAEAAFWKVADPALAEARKKYVIPFCDKHGWLFNAGRGTWSFHKGHDYLDYGDEKRIPKRLYQALVQQVGMLQMSAGSMMESYDGRKK